MYICIQEPNYISILLSRALYLEFIKVMENLQLHYSKKNIPIPSETSYKLQLMDKIEQMIKRMRWKLFFYINPSSENMQQTYRLKTLNYAPKIKEMVLFEWDLSDLVNKIKVRRVSSNFQNQLKEGTKAIKKSKKRPLFLQIKHQIYTKSRKMNTTN